MVAAEHLPCRHVTLVESRDDCPDALVALYSLPPSLPVVERPVAAHASLTAEPFPSILGRDTGKLRYTLVFMVRHK